MLEFQKTYLKCGKELFEKIEENDEEIDKDYKQFEENKNMEIEKIIKKRESKIEKKRFFLKSYEERLKFEKIFQKRSEEVFKKIFTD